MMSLLQRKSLKFFHPLLKKIVHFYLSKPRKYKYKDITIKVIPSVFHPGLFFSTKVFIDFLETISLKNESVLELGAGSGLISIYCSQRGANMTASDINPLAIQCIKENASINKQNIITCLSDLFSNLPLIDYDIILINPPYYPKKPSNIEEQAWFCGEEFEYFQKLFNQMKVSENKKSKTYMILSEDCEVKKIMSIAKSNDLNYELVFSKKVSGEKNFIFEINKSN